MKTLQLDETSKTVLVNFYCDRMDDTPSTEEIILGLSSLLKHHSLSSEEILQVFFFFFLLSSFSFNNEEYSPSIHRLQNLSFLKSKLEGDSKEFEMQFSLSLSS